MFVEVLVGGVKAEVATSEVPEGGVSVKSLILGGPIPHFWYAQLSIFIIIIISLYHYIAEHIPLKVVSVFDVNVSVSKFNLSIWWMTFLCMLLSAISSLPPFLSFCCPPWRHVCSVFCHFLIAIAILILSVPLSVLLSIVIFLIHDNDTQQLSHHSSLEFPFRSVHVSDPNVMTRKT